MATIELTDEQVIGLVKQLPPDRRRAALLAMAEEAVTERQERTATAQAQLRLMCKERGMDWDSMTEDDREAFVDDVVHEDRQCAE